jgi:hypothetical protein
VTTPWLGTWWDPDATHSMKRLHKLGCVLILSLSAFCVSYAGGLSTSASPLSPETAAASENSAATIEYLLAYFAESKLTFIRNGQEHDSAAAAAHMRRKHEYYKARIATPEDFIEQVASKSLQSGKPYLVRLPGGREASVGAWLRDALKQHRQ